MATKAEKATKAGKRTANAPGKVAHRMAGAVSRVADNVLKRVDPSASQHKRRNSLARAGAMLKGAGKVAAVAAALAAVVATARKAGNRKKDPA